MSLPSPWEFVIGALAAWRLWVLISRDEILDRPRDRIASPRAATRSRAGRLRVFLECVYCSGFWVAGLATALWAVADGWPGVISFAAVWAALAAAVALIEETVDRLGG